MSRPELPTGTVTFLMTDVEASTRLWEAHPDLMAAAIERHDALIGHAVDEHGGALIRSKGEGDSTFSVFTSAAAAVAAAVDAQLALQREDWPRDVSIRVRAALYTGAAELRDRDYYGTAPNRGARLRAVAHGGQTICSETTEKAVAGRCPDNVALVDLGLHRLRDLARAERVFQVCHPDLRGEFPPLLSLGVRQNLPASRTSFVGRADDLIALRKHLETERLVTLTGVGGCGKTRLAIETAAGQLERFPDGVFFVDLASVTDGHVVAAAVAAAVGFSRLALGTGSGRPAAELIDFLTTRDALIVIDNCEHVLDDCAHLVDEILERCPLVSVLATSREALALQGEQIYPVAPMPVPEDDVPEAADSVRLFCDRAALVRPGFVLSSENASDVAEICRRLDGIPLAIELAAAQISHLSPRQIIRRLADRLQLLSAGRGRVQRQQTLHATLEWSHGLMSDEERVVFRRLAVFPGAFSHEAADAVCDDAAFAPLLGALIGKSLVATDVGQEESRYRLLETVRLYAESKLVEAEEEGLVRDRHRDFFVEWAESLPDELTYLDADGSIRAERHNLRSALRWSETQGRLDLVGRLASTMNGLWLSDIREGRRWLDLGMQAIDDLDAEQRVRVLAVAALVAVLAIQAGPDAEIARKAVEASGGRLGLWSSLAHALVCLSTGIRFFMSRDPVFATEVETLGRQALALAPNDFSRGLAWFWLGQARVLVDDFDGAIDALEHGAEMGVAGADMSYVSTAMRAGVLHLTGRHEEALAAAESAVEGARSHGGGLWAWALYCSLPYALELGHRGRHIEALEFMRDLLEEGGAPRTPGVMTSVVVVLGALAVQRGDEDVARVLLDYAGAALMRDGIRTPVDIALYTRYLQKLRHADGETTTRSRTLAGEMSLDEAIAFGLRAPRLRAVGA